MTAPNVQHVGRARLNLSMTAADREAIERNVLAESTRQGRRLTVSEFARQRMLAPVRYESRVV